LSGIALEIPRSILTPELWLAFEAGYYEGSEISALRSAIRSGDAVLEVGAGVGFISTFVLRVLGAATVLAIEANEALIPTIHRTHELNGVSATVLTGVAGRRDGPVGFHHQAAFWGSSILPLPGSQLATIPGIDLGRIIREMRPDVLVVDVEGGERDLFDGLDLSGVRSIVVEVHNPQIGGAGIVKCFGALHDAGFAYDPNGSAGTNVVFTRFQSRRSRAGAVWAALRRRRRSIQFN
jgi:FkbM family methyltransferase